MSGFDLHQRNALSRGLFVKALDFSGQKYLPVNVDALIDILGNGTMISFGKEPTLRYGHGKHLGDSTYQQVVHNAYRDNMHPLLGRDRIVDAVAGLIKPVFIPCQDEVDVECELNYHISPPCFDWYSPDLSVAELKDIWRKNFLDKMSCLISPEERKTTDKIARSMAELLKEDVSIILREPRHPIPDFP